MNTDKKPGKAAYGRFDYLLTKSSGTALLAGIGAATAFATGGVTTLLFAGTIAAVDAFQRSRRDMAAEIVRRNKHNILPPTHPVTRMTKRLAAEAGLENPPVCILLTDPRLLASGAPFIGTLGNGKSSAILVTPGVERKMTPHELEAVMAHEITHLVHEDTKTDAIQQSIAQMPFFCVMLAGVSAAFAIAGIGAPLGLSALAATAGGVVATGLVRAGISRARERRADRGSVELTHNPWALASALGRIVELSLDRMKSLNKKEPGPVEKILIRLFRSHPKTRARREYLLQIGEEMVARDPAHAKTRQMAEIEARTFDFLKEKRKPAGPSPDTFADAFKRRGKDDDGMQKLVSAPLPCPLANPLSARKLPFNKAAAEQDNRPEAPDLAATGTAPRRFDIS